MSPREPRRRSNAGTPRRTLRPRARPAPDPDEPAAAGSPFPVVGIGASAGGLEAFSRLFERLPATTGMAFVVVQHLDPTHESALVDLLSRSTAMPVAEAADGVRVAPNHVYVIPPNATITISGGILRLAVRAKHGLHLPVNDFLRSLAIDQRGSAIGVILSGTGSDGTLGIEAIKLEGGITFAQDDRSAAHDGMPRSAVASGCVDVVRQPAGIAAELAKIAGHPYLQPAKRRNDRELPGEGGGGLDKVLALLLRTFGIDFRLYRRTMLKRRVVRRMLLRRISGLDEYLAHLRADADELDALRQDLLIGVTGFFREPETFKTLKRKVLPRLLKDRGRDQPVRAWVAGCSTGEEAYSLAIALVEHLEERGQSPAIQIFCTDANENAVRKARAGVYSDASTSELSPERLQRFFTPVDGHWQVVKRIRDLCVFARHDLTRDPPFSNMDLITCRNVLIYFDTAVQKQIFRVFHYALKPAGLLILGRSESVGTWLDLFAPMDGARTIHTRRERRTGAGFSLPARGRKLDTGEAPLQPAGVTSAVAGGSGDLERNVQRLILSEYAPSGVVVNDQWEVVHFTGKPNPYIQPATGAASFHLLKMAPEGLALELRNLVKDARRRGRSVRKEGVRVTLRGHTRDLNLEATPIGGAAGEACVMVVFRSASPVRRAAPAETKIGRGKARSSRATEAETARLKRELAAARDYLHDVVSDQEAANEELKSANEEILSSNEELQSTNEELETAKEELQSSNEELNTLNEELQHRNMEIRQTRDDLTNLLGGIQLPVVMMGRNLRIRTFTPAAGQVLRLHAADIGRSISDVNLPISVPDLEALLREAIDTVSPKEREVQDRDGCWYALSIRPYQTMDHAIDGAVLMLADIDARKRSEQATIAARDYAEAIIKTVREPLVVLDERLTVVTANQAFYEFFHMTPQDTESHFVFAIGGRQWDIPALRALLDDVFAKNAAFEDFEITADFSDLGIKTLVLNARPVRGAEARLALLAFEDDSGRRQAQRERESLLASEREARREAESANRTKDEFLAALSHELRSPLNVLLGWVWRLRAGTLDGATTARALESLERNAKLQAKLVEELLDLSRIGRGTFHVDLSPTALRPIVEAAIESVSPLADAKNVHIKAKLAAPGGHVLGDDTRLQQVVWNLLINAIKFTPSGGCIEVRLRPFNDSLRLQVSDTGKGISPALLPHVFEPFRQGDDHATANREGLGLGLAIVKTIVERLGGTAHAASQGSGRGATFTVDLPALPAGQEATDRRTADAGTVPDLSGIRALVVDDDSETRELLAVMLEQQGAWVTAVGLRAGSARDHPARFARRAAERHPDARRKRLRAHQVGQGARGCAEWEHPGGGGHRLRRRGRAAAAP